MHMCTHTCNISSHTFIVQVTHMHYTVPPSGNLTRMQYTCNMHAHAHVQLHIYTSGEKPRSRCFLGAHGWGSTSATIMTRVTCDLLLGNTVLYCTMS